MIIFELEKNKSFGKRETVVLWSHLHIKAKVLFLFKEEIKHKLPHKVWIQCVVNYFCSTKLEETNTQEKHKTINTVYI